MQGSSSGLTVGEMLLARCLAAARRVTVHRAVAATRFTSPVQVLLLCNRNLCRSPFAAAALRARIDSRAPEVVVRSAGYRAAGRGCPAPVLQAALNHGVDLSQHRSSYVEGELISRADLIIVMDGSQHDAIRARYGRSTAPVLWLGDLWMNAGESRAIPDPLGGDRAAIDAVFERILVCVEGLAARIVEMNGRSVVRK